VFIIFAAVLVVRLYFVQIVHGDGYAKDAMGQYVEQSSISEDRNSIFFTTKDGKPFAAAIMQSGWRIAITPKDIKGAEATYAVLNTIVPIDHDKFIASAEKKSDSYEEVAFRLSDEQATAIRKKKLQGVLLVQDQWRNYPGGSLAAHVLGFVGYKDNARTGLYGLEKSENQALERSDTGRYVNPFAEIFMNAAALVAPDPTSQSGNIITTIEPTVQQHLEGVLVDVEKTYHPTETGGIVMDPRTGEIVAMAALPTFDPNNYNTVDNISVFQNPLVEKRYEMGSIMKPLTMAAGLDAGVITASTTYNDTGCITRSGKKVCNFDFKARGVIPMQEILNQSLNVGATFVAEQLGHKPFTQYVRAYGLDQRTDIGLPGEIPGNVDALGDGDGPDVNYATASFGQGIAVTPIEMTRALAVLANHGKLPTPHIVKAIQLESGIPRAADIPGAVQILKPQSADTVAGMLTKVFDNSLLHGALKQEHYTIAAKTGTAQIAERGEYLSNTYLHSFFGFFPASDPRYIVFLYAVKPQGVEYASASLAHPCADMENFLINYYSIPPDR
jgi:cell division protein FtsI/penicillin-binding protein 2